MNRHWNDSLCLVGAVAAILLCGVSVLKACKLATSQNSVFSFQIRTGRQEGSCFYPKFHSQSSYVLVSRFL